MANSDFINSLFLIGSVTKSMNEFFLTMPIILESDLPAVSTITLATMLSHTIIFLTII